MAIFTILCVGAPIEGRLLFSTQGASPIRAIHPLIKYGSQSRRGSSQGTPGGYQPNRIEGQSGAKPGGAKSQLYVIPARIKAETLDFVVTSMIFMCRQSALLYLI